MKTFVQIQIVLLCLYGAWALWNIGDDHGYQAGLNDMYSCVQTFGIDKCNIQGQFTPWVMKLFP